jgi:hypothetical protein
MATRVGIELSPAACRIVELDGGLSLRRRHGDTRVRSFAVLPPSGPETRARLEALRRRQAAVVVWGGRTEHRQVMVSAGSYESMRAEAMAALSAAGLQTNGVWADIAVASSSDEGAARRPVVVSMASASDMSDALRPLRDAGIRLRTVTTPAVVLGSLARLRPSSPAPGAIESYIALEEQGTCIALVRSGVLLGARDLPWGFIDADYTRSEMRSWDDIATRLADAVGEFVAAIGGSPADIGQVCVCGGLPELRSMSLMLMERLDVEVEPLDSLFGIDAARLPDPADEFRERGAELRLAWAVAADWPPAINLLRARRRQVSKTWLARAAVVAGTAAGLSGSWWVVERGHLWPGRQPAVRTASVATPRAGGPAPAKPAAPRATPPAAASRVPVAPPPIAANRPPAVIQPPPIVNKAPVVVLTPPAAGRALASPAPTVGTGQLARSTPPVVPPPPSMVNKAPVAVAPPRASGPIAPPPAGAGARRATVSAPPPAVLNKVPVVTPRPAVVDKALVVGPPPGRVRPAPPQETAQPFDAVLGTILFSPDRKLAIIDNRIVGVGDEVRGARVVEITAATVILRDAQGRLRRLTLGAEGR